MLAPQDAELTLAALFLEPTERRREALRSAGGRGLVDPEAWLACVEMHGVLPLVHRNVRECGVDLPATIGEQIAVRDEVLREGARSNCLTLLRVLAAAASEEVDVLLLKGASLATDLYPDPALRSQADLDVLVRPSDVRTLVGAAAKAGLVPGPRQLPCWWYRCTHYHLKLDPTSNLLREVEVHWELHSPATLYTAEHSKLWERARPVKVGEWRAFTLDPVDRFPPPCHPSRAPRPRASRGPEPAGIGRHSRRTASGSAPQVAARSAGRGGSAVYRGGSRSTGGPGGAVGRGRSPRPRAPLARGRLLEGRGGAVGGRRLLTPLAPPPAHAQGEIRRSDGASSCTRSAPRGAVRLAALVLATASIPRAPLRREVERTPSTHPRRGSGCTERWRAGSCAPRLSRPRTSRTAAAGTSEQGTRTGCGARVGDGVEISPIGRAATR